MKTKGKIFILSGPSGSGKTTIYRRLLASPGLKNCLVKSISVTTRPKRLGEVHGRDYIFVSRKMFEYKKRSGHFLESMKVFDNYYGTPKKNVLSHLKAGQNVLLCIDVKGAKVVSRVFPEAIKIFIKAPSLAILKKRLEARGSESREHLQLRFETAREELKEAKDYQYVVVNDRIDDCYAKVEGIIWYELKAEQEPHCGCGCPH